MFVLLLFIDLNHCGPAKGPRNQVDNDNFNQQTLPVSNKSINSEKRPIEIMETPLKSKYDGKSYRLIRLNNGLTALLVSTLENTMNSSEKRVDKAEHVSFHQKKSACSLRIEVGSFSNPRDAQGLAHLIGNFDVSLFTLILHSILEF